MTGPPPLQPIVSWWRHQMETFSALLAPCVSEFPPKGQWRRGLMYSLICDWINSWVNNHEGGDLRRHRVHYDVILMCSLCQFYWQTVIVRCQEIGVLWSQIIPHFNCTWDILIRVVNDSLDIKVHGVNMGPTWGRQDPGGPHVGHRNLAIWEGPLLLI